MLGDSFLGRVLLLTVGSVLAACDPSSNAARSCGGERVLECDPYEWAVVTEASFTPEVPLGDPRVRPTIHVGLSTCGDTTPAPPMVQVQVITGRDDAGGATRVVELITLTADSNTSSAIDVTIDNPFTLGSSVPPDSNVVLRFVPLVGGCDGDPLEIPYRTGPVIRP